MKEIVIRLLDAQDCLTELTALVHRAYAPFGRLGLNCTGVDQSVDTTRRRIGRGDCFVAVWKGRIVGTVTLCAPDLRSECPWYRRHGIASAQQLAVDPAFQGKGLGRALLRCTEDRARARGARELALHTPRPAHQLLSFYQRLGFRPVECRQFTGKHYQSIVLSKPLDAATRPEEAVGLLAATRRALARAWALRAAA